jgi:hypothetical protein
MANTSKVGVYVRCRPLLSKEIVEQRFRKCISYSSDPKRIIVGNAKDFLFDRVFDEETGQEELFNITVKPLVESCFLGFNATVLAYGQTGSGKTYTMGSSIDLLQTHDEGVIPRAIRHIFHLISTEHVNKVVSVRVSFLEIYNEEVRDLLHPEVSPRDINIREDSMGRIFFTGAREELVVNASDVFSFIERGGMARTTADTLMNDSSSRSHAIFTVSIELFEHKV